MRCEPVFNVFVFVLATVCPGQGQPPMVDAKRTGELSVGPGVLAKDRGSLQENKEKQACPLLP